MSPRLDPSRHESPAMKYYLRSKEAPWVSLQVDGLNVPPTSLNGWSTVSSESSVQNKDKICTQVNILSLTSAASYSCFPETSGIPEQCLGDSGQAFAGSTDADVTHCRRLPSRDIGHGTRSKAPSAKRIGEICDRKETVIAAAPEVRRFACPFSKHDPVRYEPVLKMSSCTVRPGLLELKRVIEHLRSAHTTVNRCKRCRTQYKGKALADHISENSCKKVEETSYPELMTAEQEKIFTMNFDAATLEDRWRAYYQFLFPDDPNGCSISPYYDYTTLTHRLDALVAGLTTQKRPASKLDDSPQSKRQSRGVSATTPQAGSFIAESSDTSPSSRPGKSHQSKCGGKRLSPKTTNVDIFITPGLGTSPASQAEEGPQSHSRVRPTSAKTPQAGSLTTQSGDMPYNPYQETDISGFPEIASQQSCFDYGYCSDNGEVCSMNQYPEVEEIGTTYQEWKTSGFPKIASQQSCFDYGYCSDNAEVRSMNQYPEVEEIGTTYQEWKTSGFPEIASQQSCFDYGYCSDNGEVRSMNQYPGVEEIGTSKCGDDMSQSTNLDSGYGSRNGTIPSSSNSYEPIIFPKSDRGDSAIALSSNASVLISSPATQSQSGRAVQDVSNQISQPYLYPPELDPNMPSSILTPDEKIDLGFSSDLLDRDSNESLDQHYQKYEVPSKKI